MEPVTYRELKAALAELTEEQLDMSATVWDGEMMEAYPIFDHKTADELPEDHYNEQDMEDEQPLLIINTYLTGV